MAFKLTPKQVQGNKLLSSNALHLMFFGGSRSGKTFLICRAIATRAMMAPGSRHAIVRFRFNAVKQSIVLDTWPKMMRLCFPNYSAPIDKTDWYAQFPNGSQVWFGGLDEKERTEKILGMEFISIFFNEASQISYPSRELVLTRLAQLCEVVIDGKPDGLLPPRVYYDENPPSKGHWSYKLFVRHIDPDTKKLLPDPAKFGSMLMNPLDNAENLSPTYLKNLEDLSARMKKRFLKGEFADETENGLFDDMSIDKWRMLDSEDLPQMVRIVIAVDPSGSGDTENATNDEIGIVAAGLGIDGKGYLLADLTCKAGPATWGKVATDAYDRFEANAVVGEINFGGAMVNHVIQVSRPRTPFKSVTASRGKAVRAEPVAALVEVGRIRFAGYFPLLEEELGNFTTNGYVGERSPNRADAFVWAFTELFGPICAVKKKPKGQSIPWRPLDPGVGY